MCIRAPMLFVGVGSILHHDDGVGVRAAEIMASLPLPESIEVYDAGLVGLDAAPTLEDRSLVVVVDAIEAGLEPGAVVRATPDELAPLIRTGLSLHDLHLLDAIQDTRMRGHAPGRVVVLGVQVGEVSMGLGMTPAVENGMNKALRLALAELGLEEDLFEHASRDTAWCA